MILILPSRAQQQFIVANSTKGGVMIYGFKETSYLCLQWQMVIHDFTPEQSQLAVEAIVNMIINSQVQTLLRVFQYKSLSSPVQDAKRESY